jgi:putative ABC transport system ATP-binding protein
VDDLGQTIVVVTHDPVAASYADSVLFLSDGRISGQLDAPTPDRILDRLRALGG